MSRRTRSWVALCQDPVPSALRRPSVPEGFRTSCQVPQVPLPPSASKAVRPKTPDVGRRHSLGMTSWVQVPFPLPLSHGHFRRLNTFSHA